jgi:hypothetical protein
MNPPPEVLLKLTTNVSSRNPCLKKAAEVMNGEFYGLKVDCYSFAMVFYEILAETKPFATFKAGRFQDLVCRSGRRPNLAHLELPHALVALIEAAWCQDVSERFSMKDIIETLACIVHDLEKGSGPAEV